MLQFALTSCIPFFLKKIMILSLVLFIISVVVLVYESTCDVVEAFGQGLYILNQFTSSKFL